ncbi:type-2 ice-structuring protein-like [Haliotis cracherodii]|uniref:type-2 ice-structuring protein-like n=1 Tax=Haliotis cracherodii TaxID=6455 RepID=UPI0039ECF4B2
MTSAKLHSAAVVLYLMLIASLDATEHKQNDTDSCILRLKENESRVRSDVIKELKEEIKEEFKSQFKRFELLKNEVAVEKARQRVMEEKVDFSYEGVQKLEAALSQCSVITATPITVTNTTTSTTTTTTTAKPDLCAAGFVRFEDHCYILELDKTSWASARSRCRILGADLVSINTQAENDFLLAQIKGYFPPDQKTDAYFWMGMMYVGGKYTWADGTEVGFTDWLSAGEPNCMDGNCKAFITTYDYAYKWEDAGSSYDFYSICEKDVA